MGRRLSGPVLAVGGFDPSGGAGVTADVRTAAACGWPAVSVLTALTLQGPEGVRSTRPLAPSEVAAQIALLARQTPPSAVKTGMLATAAIVRAVSRAVERGLLPSPVVDPVMDATSGASLLDEPGRRALLRDLIPRARVVTPNLREAAILTGASVDDLDGMARAAERIAARGARAVVVTGGHLPGRPADLVLESGRITILSGSRLPGRQVHGLGCAFSMALACGLAAGDPLVEAARGARACVRKLIRGAWGGGRGLRLPGLATWIALVALLASGCSSAQREIEGLFAARARGRDALITAAARAAQDDLFEVRAAAAWMLAETGDARVIPTLTALLEDPAPGVRAAAASGLARLGARVEARLVSPLVRDADPAVRLPAVELLAALGDEAEVPLLASATEDPQADVRARAVSALAAVPHLPVLPEIARRVLSDEDWRVRQAAVTALGSRPEDEARALIEVGLADGNPLVRRTAADALREFDRAAAKRHDDEAAAAKAAALAAHPAPGDGTKPALPQGRPSHPVVEPAPPEKPTPVP